MAGDTPKLVWSNYQKDFFQEVVHGVVNLLVDAKAGSSKTTSGVESIVQLMDFINSNPTKNGKNIELSFGGDDTFSVIYLAFGKDIATELQQRVPAGVAASTFHSLCFRALGQHLRKRMDVQANKSFFIMSNMVKSGELTPYIVDALGASALKLEALAKAEGIGCLVPDVDNEWIKLIQHYDIELDDNVVENPIQEVIKLARTLMQRSLDLALTRAQVDFNDQLYLCIKLPVSMQKYDVVFVDEAQDTNSIQRAIVKKILKPGGKLVAVGDPYQAIYGFRGAGTNSMELIMNEFNCKKLPLSVSYRCSKAVIRKAQKYVPDIEYAEWAAEGYEGGVPEGWTPFDFQSSDAVLCRNTAPLISLAYYLIGKRIPCKVLGREIGAGLTSLIKKLKPNGIKGLQEKLTEYRNKEVSAAMAKGEETRAQAIEDKVESIFVAIDSLPTDATVPQLIQHIESLFNHSDKEDILTLSTVHKSKGKEWTNVYQLDFGLMPSRYARQRWQQEQETHLQYVAITRAKLNIYYIGSEDFKKEFKKVEKPIVDATTIE